MNPNEMLRRSQQVEGEIELENGRKNVFEQAVTRSRRTLCLCLSSSMFYRDLKLSFPLKLSYQLFPWFLLVSLFGLFFFFFVSLFLPLFLFCLCLSSSFSFFSCSKERLLERPAMAPALNSCRLDLYGWCLLAFFPFFLFLLFFFSFLRRNRHFILFFFLSFFLEALD